MEPTLLQILLLALVQGAAELLPVSSSAHVIVAEKLIGLDPASPSMTFLLAMLHTGTMVAVIAYFWKAWKRTFFASAETLKQSLLHVGAATLATLVFGGALILVIEKGFMRGTPHNEIEDLFGHLPLVGGALLTAGLLILATGLLCKKDGTRSLNLASSLWIGLSQGLCLPFRGLSRSGTTISTGVLLGITRQRVEEFSFALAVVITPPVIAKELLRVLKSHAGAGIATQPLSHLQLLHLLGPGLFGMVAAFIAGILALRLLSSWLEKGHWAWFGYYCIGFSGFVFYLATRGY
jgi:undecaprenyl-diphosphatase